MDLKDRKDYKEQNITTLVNYFRDGCKKDGNLKWGLEIEHFVVLEGTNRSAYYDGGPGAVKQTVRSLLTEMLPVLGGTPVYSEGFPVGFTNPDYSITLEPAAQLEISITPKESIGELLSIYKKFRDSMKPILENLGLELVTLGYRPSGKAAELPLIPKKRYKYMDEYFRHTGNHGINMMRGTASTQVAIDYVNEEDFRRKFRLSNILSPLFLAFMNHCRVFEGELAEGRLIRCEIWRDVDPDRCGIVPIIDKEEFGFREYAEYLWDMPLILRTAGGETIPVGEKTVGEVYGSMLITGEDVEHIISMTFPMVRLKKYLEIRTADSVEPNMVGAYLCLIKTIFSSEKLMNELLKRYSFVTEQEDDAKTHWDNRVMPEDSCFVPMDKIYEAQTNLMENGFAARIYGKAFSDFAEYVLNRCREEAAPDEKEYLDPFYKKLMEIRWQQWILEEEMDSMKSGEDHAGLEPVESGKERAGREPVESGKEAALKAEEYLKHCPEINHGRYLHMLSVPKIYSSTEVKRFGKITKEAHEFFERITALYQSDKEFRKFWNFSDEMNELILADPGYDCLIPMARFDIFYNEETGDYKFCEVNTDGTSAMNEDIECNRALLFSEKNRELRDRFGLETFELIDSWVEAFGKIYESYCRKKEKCFGKKHTVMGERTVKPYVGIVDFMEEACANEFLVFQEAFLRAGYDVEICEIRSLKYEEGKLFGPTGHRLDAIYRRAVTGDVERHWQETGCIRQAYLDGTVCLIGGFCSQVAHHKSIFKVLHQEGVQDYLDVKDMDYIKCHIPETYDLNKEIIERKRIRDRKDRWILKPYDSYGSRGVVAGCDVSEEDWNMALDRYAGKDYLVQEYVMPYETDNIYFPGDEKMKRYRNMPGLFCYSGRFAGVYSRYSDGGIISSMTNKRVTTTLQF